ncbi:hypothetical protein BOX15_Mlig030514g2 [Macrostomum lignano]|uniref:Uncharacterized protein n=1 Tax=Macrostomum lignano TaxID=282301 RepID=A0A267FNK4_9PLAT|nr:hypothetical protein BOX15_Mlig030514g2 [Macrostomum lignano]
MQAAATTAAADALLMLLFVLLATRSAGVQLPPNQADEAQAVVRYEKGDCIYETIACLYDDSCGPLLRTVYAYCYETDGYLRDRPDGSRLQCDSSCSVLLSLLFNTTGGARLTQCNYSGNEFWTQIVIHKRRACAGLLEKTDALLRRELDGEIRTDCWLAGLLCAKDFACRSTLTAVLDLPCYDGPCSQDCAARLSNFAKDFGHIFHTFLSCLCGPDLAAACPQPVPGDYLGNRSAALDQVAFVSPLDGLMTQLGRGAIREHMRDIVWLLKVFEHPFYCRSMKTIISEATCLPPVSRQPTVDEPLCTIEPMYELPETTTVANQLTTDASSQQAVPSSDPTTTVEQPYTDKPKSASADSATPVASACGRFRTDWETSNLITVSVLIFLTTKF